MTQNPVCCSPDTTLQEAAARMKSLNVGALPVCENDRLVGMLTDRDIAIRATAEVEYPTIPVRHAMTQEAVYCYEDQDIQECARLMEEKQIRRSLVLNRDKRLVGIVSLGDLAVRTRNEQLADEVLEQVFEPAYPVR